MSDSDSDYEDEIGNNERRVAFAEVPFIIPGPVAQLMTEEGVHNSLVSSLYDQFSLDIFQQPGLRTSNELNLYHCSFQYVNHEYNIRVSEIAGVFTWVYELDEDNPEFGSIPSSRKDIDSRKKYKLRHDFVAEALGCESTDIPLQDIFGRQNDCDDSISPDLILRDINGIIHVIELATTRSAFERSLRSEFEKKQFKYADPLFNRSREQAVTLSSVIVGPGVVASNMMLTQDIIDELIVRHHLSILMENEAAVLGIPVSISEDDTKHDMIAKEIESSMSKLRILDNPPQESPLAMTSEDIRTYVDDPDYNVSWKAFVSSISATREEISRPQKSEELVRKYVEDLTNGTNYRIDPKPVTIFPLIVPKTTADTSLPIYTVVNNHEGPKELGELWTTALSRVRNQGGWTDENKEQGLAEALETDQRIIWKREKDRKVSRKKYHRVSLKTVITKKVSRYLAKDGVMAKKRRKDPEVIAKKLEQKRAFSLNTNTSDIDKYLQATNFYDDSGTSLSSSEKEVQKLIDYAETLAGNSDSGSEFLKQWMKTKLFKALDLISNIAIELAISIKQNTESDEFIVKKLRSNDVYLLIKTTNSRSHVFFSLFFRNHTNSDVLQGLPFRRVHKCGRGLVTDFVSVRPDKMENQAIASTRLLSLATFWADFYTLESSLPNSFKEHPEASRMLLLSLLVSLEDKAETEETITQTRYMYMEVFKCKVGLVKPDPLKVVSKLTKFPRSRLNVWTINKVIQNFRIMALNNPIRINSHYGGDLVEGEDALPGDEWDGLLNFFTGNTIRSASAIVNIIYLGYLKNKQECSQGNADWNLLDKIVSEENTVGMSEQENIWGKGGLPPESRTSNKQYNKECIKNGCSILERRLEKLLGANWRETVSKDVMRALSARLTHEIATLKASSTLKPRDVKTPVTKTNIRKVYRVKVIEAIACKLSKFQLNPFTGIDKLITDLESTAAGIITDIFKKNQHGGLREIYVLEIEARMIQLFIETISRTLCSYFEEETMTHPQNKIRLLDQHRTLSNKLAKRDKSINLDLCCSSDKTRWSQNLQISALSIPAFRLLPRKFHALVQRILNLWTQKFMKIPPSLLKLMLSRVPLRSKSYMALLKLFWDKKTPRKERLLMKAAFMSFIQVSVGMMQGILHYLSSLLHLCYLADVKDKTLMILKKKYPNFKFLMTQVCSSDDSATILSVISEPNVESISNELLKATYDAELLLHTSSDYCRFFCMSESLKSVIAAPDYVEFNSEFILKNTIAMPVVKFVSASSNITESESMIDRAYTAYNLLSDVFASGMPAHNTHLIQISQAFIHYKTLGSSTSKNFNELSLRLLELPDPICGFFLMDTELIPGVLGYSFSRWRACTHCLNLSKSLSYINWNELVVTGDGSLSESLVIRHGDLKRWHNLMERIERGKINISGKRDTDEDWIKNKEIKEECKARRQAMIEENYELLFRHPQNIKELRIKLLIKASMPGVGKSLCKGVPFIQALCSSVYAAETHCFSTSSIALEFCAESGKVVRTKKTGKKSLLRALQDRLDRMNRDVYEGLNLETLTAIFPARVRYEEANEIIESYAGATIRRVHRMRHRKNILFVQPDSTRLPLTLVQTLTHKWFGFSIRASRNTYLRCWNHYKLELPWLQDDFHTTFEHSPFQTKVELYNFLASDRGRTRKFVRNGPTVFSTKYSSQIAQMIRKSHMRNCILVREPGLYTEVEVSENTSSQLSLALTIPIPKVRKEATNEVLKAVSDSIGDIGDVFYQTRRSAIVSVLALYNQSRIGRPELTDLVKRLGVGTLFSYTKMQDRVVIAGRNKWVGKGEVIAYSEGILLRLNVEDNRLLLVATNNWPKLRRNPGVLNELCHNLRVQPDTNCDQPFNSVGKYFSNRFQAPGSKGTPIIIERESFEPNIELYDTYWKISNGCCGIYVKMGETEFPILVYRTNLGDISMANHRARSDIQYWGYWVTKNSIPMSEAVTLLYYIDRQMEMKRHSSDKGDQMLEWLQSTLRGRIKAKGLGYTQSTIASSLKEVVRAEDTYGDKEFEDLLEAEGFFEEFLEDDIVPFSKLGSPNQLRHEGEEENVIDLLALENEEDVGLTDEQKQIMSLFSNWEDEVGLGEVSVGTREAFTYLHLHPFWDNFIDEVNRTDYTFFEKLFNGVCSVSDKDLSRLLMRLLRIKETSIETTIMQRYLSKVAEQPGPDWFDNPDGAIAGTSSRPD
uniref:RNA-directed RNA polymerase L n=1 Tax=Plecopteran phenui-related virus OKIAV280 TaxID=2746260 RepID=A0A7D7JZL2_9VIRU|nr:RNA-dependent RNA polymerase [Plecopteran phenui-related virus OKIAV280]